MTSYDCFIFRSRIKNIFLACIMALLSLPLYIFTAQASDVKHITLSGGQLQSVQNGVQQMAETQQVDLSQITATNHSGGPGVHVCGYAAYKDKTGTDQALPFYVELREKDGQPVAERGQIATDPSKLSKINFVCRKNKGE